MGSNAAHAAGSGGQALTKCKYLKAKSARPPTVMAEFTGRIVDKTFPTAVARAIRSSFGMYGVPVRVIPISKLRRSQGADEAVPVKRMAPRPSERARERGNAPGSVHRK
jgi:hypothetical protein